MAELSPAKHLYSPLPTDFKTFAYLLRTKQRSAFAYGFMFAFVFLSFFFAFSSPRKPNFSGPNSLLTSHDSQLPYVTPLKKSPAPRDYAASVSTNASSFPPAVHNQTSISVNTTSIPLPSPVVASSASSLLVNSSSPTNGTVVKTPMVGEANYTVTGKGTLKQVSNASAVVTDSVNNVSVVTTPSTAGAVPVNNVTLTTNNTSPPVIDVSEVVMALAKNVSSPGYTTYPKLEIHNQTFVRQNLTTPNSSIVGNFSRPSPLVKQIQSKTTAKSYAARKQGKGSKSSKVSLARAAQRLEKCDFFDGEWIRDNTYPLYQPGACSFIDEQFNCILNGRPDGDYQKYKWKPKACALPRISPGQMVKMLTGKTLAFVGDSLNRNMWESLICILKQGVKNKSNVYEAKGRSSFKGEASYAFVFKDYNFSVHFYASPFLVQEWDASDANGAKKETLRLDLVGRTSDQYKHADIIVFNTGHWWTHEKTSLGKDYYQEGSHVYAELNVLEAFRKALTTWGKWVDANVNPAKTLVMFRGYSETHFSGGQWNSGGACDGEREPIQNASYLREYSSKMVVLEEVLRTMKTKVVYLNITRMTDFRKDGHPSMYRKKILSDEEKRSPLLYQDCSHWCLPGVPDAWNEILYSKLFVREHLHQS